MPPPLLAEAVQTGEEFHAMMELVIGKSHRERGPTPPPPSPGATAVSDLDAA